MGQTTSKNTKNQQKRKIHVQALPCTNWFHLVPNWFLRGSYLVPTVFDSSDGCSYKLKSHLLVLMHMQCSKIGVKMFKFKVLSTAVQPLTKLSHNRTSTVFGQWVSCLCALLFSVLNCERNPGWGITVASIQLWLTDGSFACLAHVSW